MELVSDEHAKALQEEWNPKNFEDHPDPEYREVMLEMSKTFYNMSLEEYKKRLAQACAKT